MQFRVPFKLSIVSILLVMVLALTLSMFTGLWLSSAKISRDVAGQLFDLTSRNVKDNIENLIRETMVAAEGGSTQTHVSYIADEGLASDTLPFLFNVLATNEAFYSVYYGFEDGDFFQIIAVRGSEIIRNKHKAPQQTEWIVRSISRPHGVLEEPERIQHWVFLDEGYNKIAQSIEHSPSYDPRVRPWYKKSIDMDDLFLSAPYLFSSLNEPGITVSKKILSAPGVFGVDLTLVGLSKEIANFEVSEKGGVLLFDDQNQLLAASSKLGSFAPLQDITTLQIPAIQASLQVAREESGDILHETVQGAERFFVSHSLKSFNGTRLNVAVVAPARDFEEHLSQLQIQLLIISIIAVSLFIPLSYGFASKLAQQVSKLSKDAQRVKEMVFDDEAPLRSRIVEFDDLSQSFHSMRDALSLKTRALALEQEKLSRLVELGIAMSAEQDSDKLMEMVLLGAKELTNADGGTLYTLNDAQNLEFKIVRNDSLNIMMGGTSGNPVVLPPVPLFGDNHEPNSANVVSFAVHQETSINIKDAYHEVDFDFSGTRAFDKQNNYRSQSFLTVPLKPRGGAVIGALQIINARTSTGEVIPFDPMVQPFVEALAAQAATALSNRQLRKAQEDLMDSLIHLIAGAIDAKSPYTGGHCERVPELAIMLAKEACDVSDGHLGEFNFETKEEWREFQIGAWLHDCGKVITPEYVVDKATKLETIYNRIHEVRTRFEVLYRDCEIEYLKAVNTGADAGKSKQIFENAKLKLHEDFAFIAQCNVGAEFMTDDQVKRLHNLSQTLWMRQFDIRLGLSYEEELRFGNEPSGPCEEKLLDDKAFHVISRAPLRSDPYKDYDFKVEMPEHLYNQGEVYNLCVQRGTLTTEERFKINEHVMQTIVMLEKLPLPSHLKRVPEYAGTHHETMIGSGYPRKLDEDDLSIPARIMAIADVFEALTASDRPYKKAKSLSEAVKILSFFKKDGHIDPVLFDLFLTSGVYRSYGEKFLLEEQVDEVDIGQYLG